MSVRWLNGDEVRLVLEREAAVKISVREELGVIEFRVWCRGEGLGGLLTIHVGKHVAVHDTLLYV